MKTIYKAKKYENTDEIHLYKGTKIISICTLEDVSLCTSVEDNPSATSCRDEQEMREWCAKLGRSVCANCVGELYKTLGEN
jgi:hypothetical protein